MKKFELYADTLTKEWTRFYFEVESETIEEAVEKIKSGEATPLAMVPLGEDEKTIEIYDSDDRLLT